MNSFFLFPHLKTGFSKVCARCQIFNKQNRCARGRWRRKIKRMKIKNNRVKKNKKINTSKQIPRRIAISCITHLSLYLNNVFLKIPGSVAKVYSIIFCHKFIFCINVVKTVAVIFFKRTLHHPTSFRRFSFLPPGGARNNRPTGVLPTSSRIA